MSVPASSRCRDFGSSNIRTLLFRGYRNTMCVCVCGGGPETAGCAAAHSESRALRHKHATRTLDHHHQAYHIRHDEITASAFSAVRYAVCRRAKRCNIDKSFRHYIYRRCAARSRSHARERDLCANHRRWVYYICFAFMLFVSNVYVNEWCTLCVDAHVVASTPRCDRRCSVQRPRMTIRN